MSRSKLFPLSAGLVVLAASLAVACSNPAPVTSPTATTSARRTRVQPADLPDPGRFSLGWKVGKTVYLAGQAGTDATGKLVGENDMTAQSRQAFTRLDDILKQAGGNLSNLVKITIFTTDMQRASEIQQVQAEVFPSNPPTATLVQVGALARPGMLVEIEGIAVVD